MKKIILASFVLICSVVMTIKSNNYMNGLSLSFTANNIEALTDGDEVLILCGRYTGRCWDGIIQRQTYEDGQYYEWVCDEWTGCTLDFCQNGLRV